MIIKCQGKCNMWPSGALDDVNKYCSIFPKMKCNKQIDNHYTYSRSWPSFWSFHKLQNIKFKILLIS